MSMVHKLHNVIVSLHPETDKAVLRIGTITEEEQLFFRNPDKALT